jgi:hypothetical protein
MRSHADIVASIGAEKLAALRGVSVHTARSWGQRDAIPADHWAPLADAKLVSLMELAKYAAANPRKRPATAESAAA